MVFQQNPTVGWNQLLVDEIRAHGNVERSLPYYGQVLPSTKTENKSAAVTEKKVVGDRPHSTISKMSRLRSMLKGSAPSSQQTSRQQSTVSVASSSSSIRSAASTFIKNPVVRGDYLPMFRVGENVSNSNSVRISC